LSGGAALGAAPWIATGGAIAGAGALASVSKTARSFLDSPSPVPPKRMPTRPRLPSKGQELELNSGDIIIVLGPGNQVRGKMIKEEIVISGDYDWKYGQATGSISQN